MKKNFMILIGCKENEKVNIEFIFEKISYVVHINKDTKIYLIKIEEQDLYTKACEAYWKQFIKPLREDLSIEDVWIYRYLGTYGDSYFAIILDGNNFIFPEHIIEYTIGGLDFSYSEGYEILVYNNGKNYYIIICI